MSSASPVRAVSSLSAASISQLTTTDLSSLTVTDLSSLNQTQIQAFTTAQIHFMTTAQLATIDFVALQNMTSAQITAISANIIQQMGSRRIASLSTEQISAMTSAQISSFGLGKVTAMSSAQIAAINPVALSTFGIKRIAALSETQIEGLTSAQVGALSAKQLGAISDFAALSTGQLDLVSGKNLNKLGGAFISNIDPTKLNLGQIHQLNSTTISNLTTTFLDQLSISEISEISSTAISGMSVSQMESLSTTQIAEFDPSQINGMTADQQAIVAGVNPYLVEVSKQTNGGLLTYNEALSFLQSVDKTGVDATEFNQLTALANKIQDINTVVENGIDDAIVTTSSVKQLFDSVILGNQENGYNGYSDHAIGDLTSSSSASQFTALVDKWFLGADVPSLQSDAQGDVLSASYQASALQLFGPTGSPSMQDVVQGAIGDSALLAGIAATAYQDPNYIKSLFTDNGNGTYTVALPTEFGGSKFVTVNDQLPVSQGANQTAVANASTGMWVALLEKAVAQDTANIARGDGDTMNVLGNTYAALAQPQFADDLLSLAPGEIFYGASFGSAPQDYIDQTLATANAPLQNGLSVIFQRGDDFFAVTGINAPNGTVNVYDPANGTSSTLTVSSSTSTFDTIYYSGVGGRTSTS